jgi:hypothetical protein
MRSHTTHTDIQVIIRMHRDGMTVKEIVKATKIDGRAVQKIIDVKCGPAPEVEAEAEAETPVARRVAQKKAAKKAVDPLS